jgi:hypothetical protein
MKKTLGFVLALAMTASVALADAPDKKIELGINGGLALATNAGYDLGFGGQVTGLYRADENLGFGLGIGFNTFSVTGASGWSQADLNFLALLKYAFGTEKTKPYILVDAGLSSFITSVTVLGVSVSGSSSYPEIGGGGGVQFPMGDNSNFFVQATANVVIGSGSTFTYIPVDVGVNFDL